MNGQNNGDNKVKSAQSTDPDCNPTVSRSANISTSLAQPCIVILCRKQRVANRTYLCVLIYV